MTTIVYEGVGMPRVTLTREPEAWVAVLEVEGLEPQRSTTEEERTLGITSLDPPTLRVRIKIGEATKKHHRRLIDAACRVVSCAATSTTGETGGPGGLLMTYYRTSRAVRQALRLIGEET